MVWPGPGRDAVQFCYTAALMSSSDAQKLREEEVCKKMSNNKYKRY